MTLCHLYGDERDKIFVLVGKEKDKETKMFTAIFSKETLKIIYAFGFDHFKRSMKNSEGCQLSIVLLLFNNDNEV